MTSDKETSRNQRRLFTHSENIHVILSNPYVKLFINPGTGTSRTVVYYLKRAPPKGRIFSLA